MNIHDIHDENVRDIHDENVRELIPLFDKSCWMNIPFALTVCQIPKLKLLINLRTIHHLLAALTNFALPLAQDLNFAAALGKLHLYPPSLPRQQYEYHIYQ